MIPKPAQILIVDDEPQNRKLLEVLLAPEGYLTRTACTGDEALAAVAVERPDLILLDVMMPGLDGYQVAARLKTDPLTASIPIIMVSAHSDRDARLRGLTAGAEDFLTKPVDRSELWLRVRNLLRLKEMSDALADQSALLEQQVRARTADLHQLAHYDCLTGLPNRAVFYETLKKTLDSDRDIEIAVLFIDIDHFKNINDTRGHAAGDGLLRQFAERLTGCVRARDTVGRLGGDEFGLIMPTTRGGQDATTIATKILEALQEPFCLDGSDVTVSASIGITLSPHDASDVDALLQYADTAMYRAKEAGRQTFRFFTAKMNADARARLNLETELRGAVKREEFRLHYQPKVHLSSGRVCGAEALLRWERPNAGLTAPADFIAALETTGLIVSVGSWVIDEACRQMREWADGPVGNLPVSVNVSARQFLDGDLVGDVTAALERHRIPPHLLELELTESLLMANTERTIATLNTLKGHGVRVSVDDFGTGYSSLAYLRRFPVDTLKIDRSFVNEITTNAEDAAMALTIIRMAHTLKLDVVAEGVETAAQLAYLRRHHCDQMQGYFFSRPLPPEQIPALMQVPANINAHSSRAGVGTVLLFGSVPHDLSAMQHLLEVTGYDVMTAAAPCDGLELLALHDVQIIICSGPRPSNGGAEFLDLARDLHPDTLRIVFEGSRDIGAMTHAINRSGIHRYYTEPWDPDILRTDVRDALRQYWLQREQADLVVRPTSPTASFRRRRTRPVSPNLPSS
jgi:diguanylate cyclase (GGDEF)-like protein